MKTDYFLMGISGAVVAAAVIFLFHQLLIRPSINELVPPSPPTQEKIPSVANPPATLPPSPPPAHTPPPPTTINDTTESPDAIVRYSDNGFSPKEVKIHQDTNEETCLIQVVNESARPLLLRLSPHHPADGWGAPYSSIAPRASLMIDPRYRIESIAFHNHEKTDHEFSVDLDSTCLP